MTLPMTTLPMAAASSPERRSVSATTTAPSSVAGMVLREPLKLPMAVRTGSQRTMSGLLMESSFRGRGIAATPRRPADTAEQTAAMDGGGDDQAEDDERCALRDEDIGELAAPPQREPAAAGRDRQAGEVGEQGPE